MKRKCEISGCSNVAARGRKVCWACKSAKAKKTNPVGYAYNHHKQNAKARGIEFTITLTEFREFCFQCDFESGRGKSKRSYTLDRIDPSKGYVPGNLQKLPNIENSVKKKVRYDHFSDQKFSTVTVKKFSTPPPLRKTESEAIGFEIQRYPF